ncbi:Amino-acid permease BAT1 [Fusarium oxysporum f. sp. albedinis]|nr:Amino-acid permease BAT1 [Fusarium oxysporum f. sp. albedinis]
MPPNFRQILLTGFVLRMDDGPNSHFRRGDKCHLGLTWSRFGTSEGFRGRGQLDRAAGHDAADRLESTDSTAHIRTGQNNAASSGKR